MATSTMPTDVEEMQCSICHDFFVQPKILPCAHMLCRQCLLSWLQSQPAGLCPVCRCPMVRSSDRRSGKSVEDIVAGFVTDRAMAALVEAHQLLCQQHACCVCENVAAVSLCSDCGDLFCDHCTALHGKQSLSKHHALHALASLTPETLAANRRGACAQHPDKLPEVYCSTHGVPVCLLCATTDHRQCPDVQDLDKKVEDARAALQDLSASLAAQETEIERGVTLLDEQLKDVDQQTQAAIAKAEATFDYLQSVFNTHRSRVMDQISKSSSDKKTAASEKKNSLLTQRGKIKLHKRVVARAQGVVTNPGVTTLTSEMKPCVEGHVRATEAIMPSADVIRRLTVVTDREARYNMDKALADLIKVKDVSVDEEEANEAVGLPFQFHENHGANIVLTNNQHTAERRGRGHRDTIVVSRLPIEVNRLYEIRLDKADGPRGWYLPVGVMTSSPFAVTLPPRSGYWDKAVVVWAGDVTDHGVQLGNRIGNTPLYNLGTGNRLGVGLDLNRQLHLYVNGEDKGVISPRQLSDPCYAIFDVWFDEGKITALPVTSLP